MKNTLISKNMIMLIVASVMLIVITSCNPTERRMKKIFKNYIFEEDNTEITNIEINKIEPVYINDYTEDPEYQKIEEDYNSFVDYVDYYYNTLTKWRSSSSDEEIEKAYEMYYKCVEARDGCIHKANDFRNNFEPYMLGYKASLRCKAKTFYGEGYVKVEVIFNPDITEVISSRGID